MARFLKIGVAMVGVVLLGLTSVAPASAQGDLRFGIFYGDEKSDFRPERIICMTNNQIRDAIAARGYTDIALNVANENRIQVRATRDGWVQLLDFNFCSNRIEGTQNLRAAR